MSHCNFGEYQAEIRVNGRLFLGVGHTRPEAWRNACDAADAKYDSSVFTVLRGMVGKTERINYIRSF